MTLEVQQEVRKFRFVELLLEFCWNLWANVLGFLQPGYIKLQGVRISQRVGALPHNINQTPDFGLFGFFVTAQELWTNSRTTSNARLCLGHVTVVVKSHASRQANTFCQIYLACCSQITIVSLRIMGRLRNAHIASSSGYTASSLLATRAADYELAFVCLCACLSVHLCVIKFCIQGISKTNLYRYLHNL